MKFLSILMLTTITFASGFDSSNMESLGGALIQGSRPKYALEYVTDGTEKYLILKKEVGRTGNSAIWENIDHLVIPKMDDSYMLYYAMCLLNGSFEARIVAVAKYEVDVELNSNVDVAWFADLEEGKFEKISTDNVACINENYNL